MDNYNEENLDRIENWIDTYLDEMEDKHSDNEAAMDKINHIKRCVALTEQVAPGNRIARVAAKFHDVGRFLQLELLGSFNDGKVLHHNLGEDVITRAAFKGDLPICDELSIMRQVAQYHGRQKFLPYSPEILPGAAEMIDVVSRVDGIENGCIGATGYLVREAEEDAKGYRADNPDLDMKKVSPEVWREFSKGNKFDKMKLCKTYADYTLFAAVLAIQALRGSDRNLAMAAMNMKANGYESALEGYKDIFERLVEPKYKDKAFEVLKGFYHDKDFVLDEKEER